MAPTASSLPSGFCAMTRSPLANSLNVARSAADAAGCLVAIAILLVISCRRCDSAGFPDFLRVGQVRAATGLRRRGFVPGRLLLFVGETPVAGSRVVRRLARRRRAGGFAGHHWLLVGSIGESRAQSGERVRAASLCVPGGVPGFVSGPASGATSSRRWVPDSPSRR